MQAAAHTDTWTHDRVCKDEFHKFNSHAKPFRRASTATRLGNVTYFRRSGDFRCRTKHRVLVSIHMCAPGSSDIVK